MSQVRHLAIVVGPSSRGHLRIRLGDREREVPVDLVPYSLRLPNAEFVAIVEGGEFVAVEPAGSTWLTIQERIRSVLNSTWDPIGVASDVEDEYDGYIAEIYSLLKQKPAIDQLAAYLLAIETQAMGLSGSSTDQRSDVARQLLQLSLPAA